MFKEEQCPPFMTTLHHEEAPIGFLASKMHYSVLSCAQWRSANHENRLPSIQRLAVIWDEDHDTRVISAIESGYANDLLHPVLFIGERKAVLTIIVSDEFEITVDYVRQWTKCIAPAIQDEWHVEVLNYSDPCRVSEAGSKWAVVDTYFQNINNLWKLGLSIPTLQMPSARKKNKFSLTGDDVLPSPRLLHGKKFKLRDDDQFN